MTVYNCFFYCKSVFFCTFWTNISDLIFENMIVHTYAESGAEPSSNPLSLLLRQDGNSKLNILLYCK